MTAASEFFNWFTAEIDEQGATLRDEYLAAAQELKDWYQKETGITDDFVKGGPPSERHPRPQRRQGQHQQPKRRPKSKRRKK